jgi:uncharacterized protein YkwD
MLIGFVPTLFVVNIDHATFLLILGIGILCFLFAYFLYAVKCWGGDHQIGALFIVTIPLFSYFLAISKIPDSTSNILFYLFIQFCFYGLISAIVLYVCNIMKTGITRFVSRRSGWHDRYFYPDLTYSVIGVVVVSFLLVSLGGVGVFSDNTAFITSSLQKINSPLSAVSGTGSTPISANSQNSQIIPTLQPEVVNNIQNAVANSAPIIDTPTLEQQVHEGINEQRTSNGLSSLSYDSSLVSIARKHSADMALNNYFAHTNLQGLDPSGRATQAGYSCYKNYGSYYTTGIAENIFQNNLYDSVTYYNGIPRYA